MRQSTSVVAAVVPKAWGRAAGGATGASARAGEARGQPPHGPWASGHAASDRAYGEGAVHARADVVLPGRQ